MCWIHAERHLRRIVCVTDEQHRLVDVQRQLVWWFYADLKLYKDDPTAARRTALRQRFDRIFTRVTGFAELDQAVARTLANKDELLLVLDRPDIPLHTNGSENDVRSFVTKRRISGETRSAAGKQARDTFLSLLKTCSKLAISFWDYLCPAKDPGRRPRALAPRSHSPKRLSVVHIKPPWPLSAGETDQVRFRRYEAAHR